MIISSLEFCKGQKVITLADLTLKTESFIKENKEGALKWIGEHKAKPEVAQNDTLLAYLDDKMAELLRVNGSFNESIEIALVNLKRKQKLNNPKFLSETYTILGKTYANKGDYDKAVEAFFNMLKLLEGINEKKGIAFSLNNIAVAYDLQKNYYKAMLYYSKSIEIKKQLNDSAGLATAFNNIAITYFNLKDIDKSIEFHKKALELNKILKREEQSAKSLNNLGFAYYEKGNLPEARMHLYEALSIRKQIGNKKDIATTQNNLALVWLQQNSIDSALMYNNLSLSLAKKINALALIKDGFSARSQIERFKKNYNVALLYQDSVILYKDSLINEENITTIAEVEAKYEYEKMQRKISDQKLDLFIKDQTINNYKYKIVLGILTILVLVSVLVVSLISLRSYKKNKALILAQKMLIENQNTNLKTLNNKIATELDKTKLGLEDKNKMLQLFYEQQGQVDLPPELLNLSRREMEVLSYLALGWSDAEISEGLFVSKATTKTHLRRIYSKLLVKGRAEAVTIAHKYKIIGAMNSEEKVEL